MGIEKTESKPKPKSPDYKVGCLNKVTGEKGNIGAAWLNNDGTINIVLNNLVVVQASKDLVITLFPKNWH